MKMVIKFNVTQTTGWLVGRIQAPERRAMCLIIGTRLFLVTALMFGGIFASSAQEPLHLIATMTGEKVGDEFSVVAGVGDVNGDGYDDILVGAPGGDYAKLYFGGSPFDTVADLKLVCEQPRSLFGNHIAGIGDVNKDGYDDILIGATAYAVGGKPWGIDGAGKAYLYLGGSPMDTVPDLEFVGKYYRHFVGSAVSGAGDVNSDGFDDFMIGAPYNEYDARGRMYLFWGGTKLDTLPAITFTSDKVEDLFGNAGTGIGDTNSDGFDDIIIGAPAFVGPIDTGRVMIYFGGATMDTIPDVTLFGPQYFGFTVSNAGDLNGDRVNDFMVLSPGREDNIHLYLGIDRVYLIPGSGMGVGGDINHDGFNDFLIGNLNYKDSAGVMIGQVSGYYGAASLDTLCDFSMVGENKWGEFSKYLAIAGDLNGDGFDEVLVGAPRFPDYENPVGKVYVYSYAITDGINNPTYPEGFRLSPNYPNPINSTTTIAYDLPFVCHVTLEVFNIMGQRIAMLVAEQQSPGPHHVLWEGRNDNGQFVSNGIYFAKILVQPIGGTGKVYGEIQKLVLLK